MKNTKKCKKCNDTGWYQYDHNHSQVCEFCCTHADGWWVLREHYGKNNGKFCCLLGCGYTLTSKAIEKMFHEQKVYHLYNDGVLWGITKTKKQAITIKKRLSPENRKVMTINLKYYIRGN